MTDWELLSAVNGLLGEQVEYVERLTEEDRRNTVVRVRIVGGPDAGSTRIVKRTVGLDDPAADQSLRQRFFQEAAAGVFLARTAPGEHTPRCRGVDPERGLMVFDDLGGAPDLAGSLLGDDAPNARERLLAYVRRLGAMHAATAGRLSLWDEVVAELGAPAALRRDQAMESDAQALERGAAGLDEQLRQLGLPEIDEQALAELQEIRATIRQPNAFTALVHRDSCPDNVIITTTGVQLIDFEFARPGHALLDGLYPQLPFPTCWCSNRVPAGLDNDLASAYRAELVKGVPQAADDAHYDRAVTHVMAYWLVASFEWVFADVLTQSRTWGIASTRSRELTRLELFVNRAAASRMLPRLRGMAERLHGELSRRWATEDPLPVYPAFRTASSD